VVEAVGLSQCRWSGRAGVDIAGPSYLSEVSEFVSMLGAGSGWGVLLRGSA